MQKYFTIGETAEINGISIKTLRHYDEIGLLKPAYIDPVTKYRYYEYGQFPYIDKIKRYKNVGMSLKDIKDFFDHKSLQKLEEYLKQQMDKINKEAEKLEQMKQNTELLITYFNDAKNIELDDRLYKKQEPVFRGIYPILLGIDMASGCYQVEGSALLWDELCAFQGLDKMDI